MKEAKIVVRSVFLVLFGLLLLGVAVLPGQAGDVCCIAGTYKGFQINNAKPNCPAPARQNFTMVIKQRTPCTTEVAGTVTDSAGTTNDWTGTLTPGLRGCCTLEGSFTTPGGNTVKFKGSICRVLGKWKAKGTWTETPASDPCKGGGSWEMTQS
jgi:hypothetical protein